MRIASVGNAGWLRAQTGAVRSLFASAVFLDVAVMVGFTVYEILADPFIVFAGSGFAVIGTAQFLYLRYARET